MTELTQSELQDLFFNQLPSVYCDFVMRKKEQPVRDLQALLDAAITYEGIRRSAQATSIGSFTRPVQNVDYRGQGFPSRFPSMAFAAQRTPYENRLNALQAGDPQRSRFVPSQQARHLPRGTPSAPCFNSGQSGHWSRDCIYPFVFH